MPEPFILLQLTDLHIGASWGGWDPDARVAQTIESVGRLADRPDAILITGDLADNDADAEYATVKRLLDPLGRPCHVLPGNHDDRAAMRREFSLPGDDDSTVNYSVDLGPLRLVALDSTKPGHDGGELDQARMDWLDQELSAARDQATMLAMHHPPLLTGEAAWDRIGLPATDLEAVGRVLERHPQVRLVVGGHLHRTIVASLVGRTVLAAPATYGSSLPDFAADELKIADGPPSFVLHSVTNGAVASHVLSAE